MPRPSTRTIWATVGSTVSCWRSFCLRTRARPIRSTGGERACPPKDCGGIPGFYDLLGALGDPTHEQHDELRDCVGEDYDPDVLSLDEVNRMLAPLRRQRGNPSRGWAPAR